MHRKLHHSWKSLSPRARRALAVAAVVDGTLKAIALTDLARRPDEQIRGSKRVWAPSIALINSLGVVPVLYFTRGVRRS